MKKIIILLFIIALPGPTSAVDLFGVNLSVATPDQFRMALQQVGVKPLRKLGGNPFYDTYKADTLLQNALQLHIGFVKSDRRFAFAEYEFNGLEQPAMLHKLNKKYGQATITKGKYLSDQSLLWQQGEIMINLSQDWKAYKTRLIYFNKEALTLLREERSRVELDGKIAREKFLKQAY
jgi:hypothetical protein